MKLSERRTRRRLRSECCRLAFGRVRNGLSLAEVVVSTLLIGLLMAGALMSVGAAARSTSEAADASDAVALARQLLEEIVSLPYEDPNQTPAFGLENGETAAPGARTACDDLDDYNNWSESPPRNRDGSALSGYSAWSRSVRVRKVDPLNRSVMLDSALDKGQRLITISVVAPSGRTTVLSAYRSLGGGALQPQGVSQSLVTWVGVTLQSGAGSPVSSGVSLSNHATDQ